MSGDARLYGLVAEFDSPQALMDGVREAYEHGYRQMDAYSPFPIEGLAEAMGFTADPSLDELVRSALATL